MKNPVYFCLIVLSFFIVLTGQSQVVINEFSAANLDQFFDNYGDDGDWIELYNGGISSIDLSGYYLSDKIDNPTKFEIPNGVSIEPGDYLLIWASDRDEYANGVLHTNFKITQTRNSEGVVLTNPSGSIIDFHDIEQPNQLGHSWARISDGGATWGVSLNPSPGAANTNVSNTYADKPAIAPAAGFYAGSVEISIAAEGSDVSIYYTIDGTVPDENATLYTGPFTLSNTAVVKAITISDNPLTPASFVDFHTYLINEVHSIPVVSVTGNQLFELVSGSFIEPIGTFELFDASGDRVADASGEFNKHGNDSWAYDQRGIDYITRDQFGDDHAVKHAIFNPEITDRDQFQRLILKAAANDNYPFESGGAHIRDAYVHTLSQLANLELDERTNEPCILYINGEYWGVYEIREKVDDPDYTKYYYDQGRRWIDFIKTWGFTWEEYGSFADWYELTNYINSNDMTNPANYAYVEERLNFLSLIDYIIIHSHNVSSDWLNYNTGWWRGRKPDGAAQKWRYILWDEDATFGHYINYTGIPDQSSTADPCNPEEIDPFTDFEGHLEIFAKLSENPEFFALYINRYADLNNSYFTCEFMLGLLDDMIARIEPEMQRHINRWGGSMNGWQNNVQELRAFIETRCTIISDGIVDCYENEGITGPFDIEINVEPPASGKVRANTIVGLNYPWNAQYFGGVDFNLEAIPEDGYEFSYWEVANHTFGPDQFAEAISMSLETDDIITAWFQPSVPCGIPYAFEIDSTLTSIALNWQGPINSISYEVHYRKSGTVDWEILNTIDPELTVGGLEDCTDYEFEIRSICSANLSSFEYFIAQTACIVSTNSPEDIFGSVAVYPNPFTEQLNIEVELRESKDISIQVLDLTGQLIWNQEFEQSPAGIQVFNPELPHSLIAGMYLISIETDQSKVIRKVVKTNN